MGNRSFASSADEARATGKISFKGSPVLRLTLLGNPYPCSRVYRTAHSSSVRHYRSINLQQLSNQQVRGKTTMLVRYWQPFQEIDVLRRQLDQAFAEMSGNSIAPAPWAPAVELQDDGDAFVLRAQLPGMKLEEIDVQVGNDAVVITAERRNESRSEEKGYYRSEFRYGQFRRVVPLPATVQNDQVQAEYKDGILSLTLPKYVDVRKQFVKINLADLKTTPSEPITESTNETTPEVQTAEQN